jgi:hypothetical protein
MVERVACQIALLPFASFPTFLVAIPKHPLFQTRHPHPGSTHCPNPVPFPPRSGLKKGLKVQITHSEDNVNWRFPKKNVVNWPGFLYFQRQLHHAVPG